MIGVGTYNDNVLITIVVDIRHAGKATFSQMMPASNVLAKASDRITSIIENIHSLPTGNNDVLFSIIVHIIDENVRPLHVDAFFESVIEDKFVGVRFVNAEANICCIGVSERKSI